MNLKYVPIVIIVSLILVYVSRSMSNHILLFPFWLNLLLFFMALPVALYYSKKWNIFSSDKEENQKLSLFFKGILAIIFAFVLLCAYRLPINIFIKQQSKKNELHTQVCPITFYSLSLKNQQRKRITFTFNNKNVRMKVRPTIMQKIKSSASPQKNIQLQIRKSILGTYVVEDYTVD